jgi:hypothetical protein
MSTVYDSVIEDIIFDVRDFIRANYDTYLTQINSAKGDSVKVQSIKDANIEVEDSDPHNHSDYPILSLYPTDVNVSVLSNSSDAVRVDITALIAIKSGNPTSIVQKALRYTEALRAILRDYRDLGGTSWDMDPEATVNIAIYPSHADETGLKIATVEWRIIQDVTA